MHTRGAAGSSRWSFQACCWIWAVAVSSERLLISAFDCPIFSLFCGVYFTSPFSFLVKGKMRNGSAQGPEGRSVRASVLAPDWVQRALQPPRLVQGGNLGPDARGPVLREWIAQEMLAFGYRGLSGLM